MSPHLIDPVARAIDDAMGPASAWHRTREFLRRAPNRAARRLTARFRGAPTEATYLADGSRRFLPVENFPIFGALRLNVIGREPNGRVARSEMNATIDLLEAELLALRDADTVIRTADHYDNVDGSGMADVLVEWVDDTVVEAVTSPTIGTIRRPSGEFRTGTHRQDGLAILCGPQFPAGVRAEMQSVDLWPTLAEALGVDAGEVDGTALPVAAASTHRAT